MKLLLDTNVVLWLLLGERRRVPDSVSDAIADRSNTVLLSAASIWEIAVKRSSGKLEIEDRWAEELRRLDLDGLPVTAEHATAVEQLPWHHRGPFDRILLAQALVEDASLVTADRRLSVYGVEVLWA